jgi:hypothetical protein
LISTTHWFNTAVLLRSSCRCQQRNRGPPASAIIVIVYDNTTRCVSWTITLKSPQHFYIVITLDCHRVCYRHMSLTLPLPVTL